MLPTIKETSTSSYNLANAEYTFPPISQVVSTQGFNNEQKFKLLKNKDCLVHLETRQRLEAVLKHCTNIDCFQSMESLIAWVLLTGYKIPLITNHRSTTLAPNVNVQELLKQQGVLVYPMLKCKEPAEYARLVAEFYYQRFPQRTSELIKAHHSTLTREQWFKSMLAIFLHNDYGHSVSPAIFDQTPENQWMVPPQHALPSSRASKSSLQPLSLVDVNQPMKCSVCQNTQVWQFAYKHCQCTQSLTSCFQCALQEWYTCYQQGEVNPTHNHNIVLATCKQCRGEWSIFALLHVQGMRDWFLDRAKKNWNGFRGKGKAEKNWFFSEKKYFWVTYKQDALVILLVLYRD